MELTAALGSTRQALQLVGLSRSTWHYRTKPRAKVTDPVLHADRSCAWRISTQDRAQIEGLIQQGWREGASVDQSFANAWDAGIMLGSQRSWGRVARGIKDQSARPKITAGTTQSPRSAPVVIAMAPDDAWTWDITDLPTPYRGMAFKAYCAMDIFSRKVVAYRVEEREVDELAKEMFEIAFGEHGIPGALHSDSGPAMKSNALKDLFADLGVTQTRNPPRVSNDNPYSESAFKTMKTRPHYPGTFSTLEQARTWMATFVEHYNSRHKHSGIALFTPNEVHDGTWRATWQQRAHVQHTYYMNHPERFTKPPTTPTPTGIVGINIPTDDTQKTAA